MRASPIRLCRTRTDTRREGADWENPGGRNFTLHVRWRDLAPAAGNSWAASTSIRTHRHVPLPRRRPDDVRSVMICSLQVEKINGRARGLASTCPKEELAKANGTMGGISARGGDGIPLVALVPPHFVAGPLDARTEARGGDGGVFAQLALRTRQLPLARYSRQNPSTDLEEYRCRHQDVQGMSGLARVGNGCRVIDV